jgi:hypothetical protein
MTEKHTTKKLVNLVKDYQKVFNSKEGQHALFDLIRRSEILNSASSDWDPYRLAFNEGRRSIVLYILSKLDTDPEAFRKILIDMDREEE